MVERKTKRTVFSGPFAGIRYPASLTVGNALPSKFLGIYECELHPFLDSIKDLSIGLIIDVGAAEGYYVAGLARLFPAAEIIAFEGREEERKAIRCLEHENGFKDRLQIEGWCIPELLRAATGKTDPGSNRLTLLVMDIEGGEYELLDPAFIANPGHTVFIVEVHDPPKGEPKKDLLAAFENTHEIHRIQSRERSWEDIPPLFSRFLKKWILHVSSDQRLGKQEWLCMIPKHRNP